ncbi:MAG TPA: serine/threonine-protein kinase [Gemmatimonadaceae bacterium]|nr:serine/threonine-protein kinase [Gemmatimonadaceae bacterium]
MNDYLRDRVTVAVGTQYLIEREIGRGGMAVVYRATDLRLHRPVAIKVLPPDVAFNPDVRARFIREAQTAAQLSHPNIVPIYNVDEADGGGLVYFVMSYIDGESLGVRLAREGAWPVDRAVRVLRDVADALAYAHARGVIHRDIKPDNILIDRASGRPMVTDFGIARAAQGETRLTAPGITVGTPAYMSPEQALGEREIDGRSDLYSLAVVGYHMLAGEAPFKAANTPAMLVKHATERPRPIRERRPDVPAYLAVAIDRALAKRPEDRWSDAAEFRDALDGAIASSKARESAASLPEGRVVSAPMPSVAPLAVAPPHAPVAFPPPPPGLSRGELKHWYRAQQRLAIGQQLQGRPGGFIVGNRVFPFGSYDDRPLEERVLSFRHSVFNWIAWTGVFFGINVATHGPGPWFIFPSAFMLLGVIRKAGSIWSDGIGPIDAFKKGIRAKLRAQRVEAPTAAAPPPALTPEQLAAQLAPADVLGGPHGETVRRAASDRALIQGIISGLGTIEREMIPDIVPTVDALTTRVATLATTLHRLDTDVSGASLGSLDQRIAVLQAEPDAPDRDRRIQLLQRQRVSLHDLLERRRSLANDLESAGLMLQTLKLDLLKFRSSGIGSVIEDQTSATQEARALSRDIGHVVQAAEDLKKL